MRRFRKRSDLTMVVVPGVGPVSDGRVLEGEQYAKFCPSILEEAESSPAPAPASAPAPAPAPRKPEEFFSEEETRPDMSWRKKELIDYAEKHGLDVDGMTKSEILDAIGEQ